MEEACDKLDTVERTIGVIDRINYFRTSSYTVCGVCVEVPLMPRVKSAVSFGLSSHWSEARQDHDFKVRVCVNISVYVYISICVY